MIISTERVGGNSGVHLNWVDNLVSAPRPDSEPQLYGATNSVQPPSSLQAALEAF